jgi:radical SAM superfamily enzyme YgiQ (UPF0313 family)
MIDFLFIKPGNQKILYAETSAFNLTAVEPPFWPLLLASFLTRQNVPSKIVDLEVQSVNFLNDILIDNKPKFTVICVSGHNPNASIMSMAGLDDLCKNIKDVCATTKIILHGLYPSSCPTKVLEKHKLVDEILMKEGFLSLGHLMGYKRTEPISINDIGKINWSLIDIAKYRAHNWHLFGNIHNRSPYGIAFTSFGCPHNCDFCCVNLMYSKVQLRDIDLVFQDIKNLYDRGVKNFKFMDELFLMHKGRVQQLCSMLIANKMQDINGWAYARTDSIDEDIITLMKNAGVKWLGLGYESGSQLILDSSDKKQSLKKAYQATEICKKVGMNICGNFVFGLADDNYKTMEETLKLSIDLQPEWANYNVVFAFPGTKLYDKVKNEPWFNEPTEYEQYSQHGYSCTPMGTKYLSPKEVLEFKDEAFREFYQNENYLRMLEVKFGVETREYVANSLIYYPKRKLYDLT